MIFFESVTSAIGERNGGGLLRDVSDFERFHYNAF